MAVAMPMPVQTDWVKTVLFDRGYLSRIRGEAIKVYLVIIEACGGLPDRSVTISLSQLMKRTRLSCPTVIESLTRLEDWAWSSRRRTSAGKVKTYYVPDPRRTDRPEGCEDRGASTDRSIAVGAFADRCDCRSRPRTRG